MFVRKFFAAGSAALFLALGASVVAAPNGPKTDSRVEDAMKELGYKYQVNKEGLFTVMFPLGNGKTAPLFVDSETKMIDGQEVRVVGTGVRMYDGEVPDDAVAHIKKVNAKLKTAQFVLVDLPKGKTLIAYLTYVDADASDTELDRAFKAVVKEARSMAVALDKLD
jgi:hypothetical protein